MGQQVDISLNLNDNGSINKATNNTKKLKAELTGAQKVAQATGKSVAASRAAEITDRGLNRGATGVGGGSDAKDFSRQAQGLGGLVHVYATFAANLFAVSAAFNALSKAADVTNMVKGLDQLGAASGQALGSLAKRLTDVTDGAVSMKQAMEATAQASSGGLSGDQLLRLTKIAKNASQALGRDMGDALSRLSKGVIKIEPELLDELGIMVRVDEAAQNYARGLGKTVTSLTQFEKRQAFANAVLEQGEKKFNAINIDANPYNKILASMTNLALAGGELLNKVLGPIVKTLGESPVALGAAMAGIVGLLLSKAIPALGQWRQGLLDSAKAAEDLSASKYKDALNAKTALAKQNLASIEGIAESEYALQEKLLKKFSKRVVAESANVKNKLSEADLGDRAAKALKKDPFEIKKKDLKALRKESEILFVSDETAGRTLGKYVDSLERAIAAEKAHKNSSRQLAEEMKKPIDRYSRAGALLAIYERAQIKATSSSIVAGAVGKISTEGFAAGWGHVNDEIDKFNKKNPTNQIGIMRHGFMQLKTTILSTVGTITTFVNAFGWITMVVGTVIAAFSILDGWLSNNSKQMEEYNNSSEAVKSASEGLSRTLDNISNKDPFEFLSVESTQAKATAINELSNSFSKLVKNLEEVNKNASWWDVFVDTLKADVGLGLKAGATKVSVSAISDTLNSNIPSADKKKFQNKISEILNISDISATSISDALKDLDPTTFITKLKELSKAQQEFSNSLNNTASKLVEYNTAAENTEKQMQTLLGSFNPTDNLAKFGIAQIDQSVKLAEALKEPESALKLLSDAAVNFNKLKILPPEVALNIVNYKAQLVDLRKQLGDFDKQILTAQSSPEKFTDEEARKEYQNEAEANRKGVLEDISKVTAKFADSAGAIYKSGTKHLADSFKNAAAEAANSISKGLISGLSGPGSAEANRIVQLEAISIQEKIIVSQAALIISQEELKLAVEEQTIEQRISAGTATGTDIQRKSDITDLRFALQGPILSLDKNIEALPNRLKIQLLNTKIALTGASAQLQKTGAERANANNTAELAKISERAEKEKQILQTRITLLKNSEDILNLLTKSNNVYIDSLEKSKELVIQERQALELKQEEANLEVIIKQSKFRESNLKGGKLREAARQSGEFQLVRQLDIIEAKRNSNNIAEIFRIEERYNKEFNALKDIIEIENRRAAAKESYQKEAISTSKTLVGITREAGLITEGSSIEQQAKLDALSTTVEYTAAIRDKSLADKAALAPIEATIKAQEELRDKQTKVNDTYIDAQISINAQNKKLIELTKTQDIERDYLEKTNKLKLESIKIQAEYQKALVATEETMKRMESTASGGAGAYFGALADDFNNKLTAMIKAAKSAGDTFNQGLIGAIDKSIDTFFDMMQKSELTFKGMIFAVRNSLSDVFRDTASQLMKNAWKDALKGILGESTQEKAAKAAQSAMENLKKAQEENTIAVKANTDSRLGRSTGSQSSNGYGQDGQPDNSSAVDAGEIRESASTYKEATATFGSTVTQLGTDFGKVLSGQMSAMDLFKNLISNLGTTFLNFITQLGSTLFSSSASNSGGSGFFGDLLGGIFGGGGSSAFDFGSAALNDAAADAILPWAKGGAFSGSRDLSAYSNTIVTSPTRFFAKGGNVMGEAGPEAILPLKRDPSGNLGIRGGSGGEVNNNVTISISVENGSAKTDSQSSDSQTATQLGNVIKAVVSEELIKQSRPGGLLAR